MTFCDNQSDGKDGEEEDSCNDGAPNLDLNSMEVSQLVMLVRQHT